MCGIAGIWDPHPRERSPSDLREMLATLKRRGPDAQGRESFSSAKGPVYLGHRRLSILDLSPSGSQPMENRRFALVFNGEIYNHNELRTKLAGPWAGRSDTEVLLKAITEWGLAGALARSVGMFALALWDKQEEILFLARDRMGEKPLYWHQGERLLFSSTSEAIARSPGFRRSLSKEAETRYLQLGFVPTTESIWERIRSVNPGTFLSFTSCVSSPQVHKYWDPVALAQIGRENLLKSEEEAFSLVKEQISISLSQQRMADVPVGCFLSSGIDSSLLASLLAKSGPLKTFTAAFSEGLDESKGAETFARAIGSEHAVLNMSADLMLELIPKLVEIYEEPFGDASAIPTALLCQKMKTQVTVAISGDGADELFGGYNRHLWANQWGNKLLAVPRPIRTALRPFLEYLPLPSTIPQLKEKKEKLARLMEADDFAEAYWILASQGLGAPHRITSVEEQIPPGFDASSAFQLRDQLSYLPSDILVKVDRAAMYSSLETRAPYLDHRLVELSWRIPSHWKISREGTTKWILKELWKKEFPKLPLPRNKVGFSPPLREWMLGPLRHWVEENLGSPHGSEPHWQTAARNYWGEIKRGRGDPFRLWSPLMLTAWRKHWRV